MPRVMVQLDDHLLAEVKRLTGARTKRAAIETALAELVRLRKAAELATFAGRIPIRLTRCELRAMREGPSMPALADTSAWIEFFKPRGRPKHTLGECFI